MKANNVLIFSIFSYENTLIYDDLKKSSKKILGDISYESKELEKIVPFHKRKSQVANYTKILSYSELVEKDKFPYLAKKVKENIKNKFVSIDPYFDIFLGYVTPYNIILSSDFDDFHKIYLTQGVYAEVIYFYQNQNLVKNPTAFTFFSLEKVEYFFKSLRIAYMI